MYPVLFKIGKFTFLTYSFFIAIGLISGILLAWKEAKRAGEDPGKIMDLCFYLLIAAIVGSRLFYIAANPGIFFQDPLEIIRIQNGGLVFYGGFIAALITGLIYMKLTAMPLWKTADIIAPSIAMGQFSGMLGCFFAGCCYGKRSDFPWAVWANTTTKILSINSFLTMVVLLWIDRHRVPLTASPSADAFGYITTTLRPSPIDCYDHIDFSPPGARRLPLVVCCRQPQYVVLFFWFERHQ